MARPQPITTRKGRNPGEFIVTMPPGWELRLRRVLKQILGDSLPDEHAPGLSQGQRLARARMRRRCLQAAICQFVSDLITADLVGKEVALSSRSRLGARSGTLREHVHAILREAAQR